jgi:hypothetical protein
MQILHIVLAVLILFSQEYPQENKILFDGVSLEGWEPVDFEGHGSISVKEGCIIIEAGELISGIRWIKDFPKTNYEVSLEAKRVQGSDFFCGMTFPVKESFLTLVIGGWGGSVVGLSCIDGYDAANNFTCNVYGLSSNQWYSVRLKVTDEKIEAWIDDYKVVDFTIDDYDLSLRWEVESSMPFGITTYRTTGALRNITLTMDTE